MKALLINQRKLFFLLQKNKFFLKKDSTFDGVLTNFGRREGVRFLKKGKVLKDFQKFQITNFGDFEPNLHFVVIKFCDEKQKANFESLKYDYFSLHENCLYSEFSLSVFSQNAGKYGTEKLLIRGSFTQCFLLVLSRLECQKTCQMNGRIITQIFIILAAL